MKKIKYITLLVSLVLWTGCEGFLDTDNLTKKDTSNFPSSQTDAEQMITGIYSVLNSDLSNPEQDPFFVFELAGDDRLGGGSTSNKGSQGLDRLMNSYTSNFKDMWSNRYSGIFRANSAIASMDNVTNWTDNNVKNKLLGEAYFLRAYFYYDLVTVFGQVPLVLTTEAVNLPKSSADKVYAQITSDLTTAISLFPSTKYPDYGEGHASKWAAEALLARVFLFYTGFYGQSALPTVEGGTINKSAIINNLEDCIANSGHGLLSDQRNLWPYTNPYTAKNYQYDIDNNLKWATDENEEVIFSLKMSNNGTSSEVYFNRIVEYFNPRKTTDGAYPFSVQGYSNGPASLKLWTDWASDPDYASDYRRQGSICDRAAEIPKYAGDKSKEVENTGLLAKKYLGCGAYDTDGTLRNSYAYFYGGQDNRQYGLTQAIIYIRFADVLLMHSELTDGKTIIDGMSGINKVRQRANLPSIAYSLEALKKERRYELCFEGLRWNDLRRWGEVQKIVDNQTGQAILNRGKADVFQFDSNYPFMQRYKETGGGFWKIPESQITLSNGVLEQNEGWEDTYDWVKLPYSTI